MPDYTQTDFQRWLIENKDKFQKFQSRPAVCMIALDSMTGEVAFEDNSPTRFTKRVNEEETRGARIQVVNVQSLRDLGVLPAAQTLPMSAEEKIAAAAAGTGLSRISPDAQALLAAWDESVLNWLKTNPGLPPEFLPFLRAAETVRGEPVA